MMLNWILSVLGRRMAHVHVQVLVERMELVRHIVDEAARLVPPGRLTFHWSHACEVHANDLIKPTHAKSIVCRAKEFGINLGKHLPRCPVGDIHASN